MVEWIFRKSALLLISVMLGKQNLDCLCLAVLVYIFFCSSSNMLSHVYKRKPIRYLRKSEKHKNSSYLNYLTYLPKEGTKFRQLY